VADNGGNADGLAIKFGSGAGNVVRGCRIYHNSGDGLDLTDFTGLVTITGTWSYGNGVNRWDMATFAGGGNGFKLGGGAPGPRAAHVITDSAAWDNGGYGFTESGNRTTITLTNNTAYRNGKAGFALVSSTSVLSRNLALANVDRDTWLGETVTATDNSWNQSGWATTILRSGDARGAEAPRGPDGSLPVTTFLLNRRDIDMGASMTSPPALAG
jgi:parallel beta-helix repeat protein